VHKSTPFYKEELLSELKSRLGRKAIPKVAENCDYSDRYIRSWFKSFKHNDEIKDAAIKLLTELKKEEKQSLLTVSQ
tara:strand:+ start:4886 stop:5116 length:231 start_codon:yes stop_codon:yes gene_type:complete